MSPLHPYPPPSSGLGPSSPFPSFLPISTIKDFALIPYLVCLRDSFRTPLKTNLGLSL